MHCWSYNVFYKEKSNTSVATAKTKLLLQQSIWLLQLRDYPYYANFVNAVLKSIHPVGADT